MNINELDVIFISLDEPNADENWLDLLDKCPCAKRSHGVLGSDAAHKAAAGLSETSRLITVDADNIVHSDFFNLQIDLDDIGRDDVISWAGKNEINGLVYGNGGVKCWPKHVIENMKTHEIAHEKDVRAQVDFCWKSHYVQMNNCYSTVYNNASPLQAWRAGFREGSKMTLHMGDVVNKEDIQKIHPKNYQRLLTWMTVGADAENGLWAIYGARQGCLMTVMKRDDWDWRNIRDFEWLNSFWNEKIAPGFSSPDGKMCVNTGYTWKKSLLLKEIRNLGDEIRFSMNLEIAEMDEEGSRFFKRAYVNPLQIHPTAREIENEDFL